MKKTHLFRSLSHRDVIIMVIFTLLYIIAGKWGLTLAFANASATAVWPPTGLALGALLLFGFHLWPAIFVGAFFTNVTTAGTIGTSLGIALGNTFEAVIGAYLVAHFARGRNSFDRVFDVFIFGVCVVIATGVSATVGVATLYLGNLVASATIGAVWLTWWLGDLSSALIITPFLLLWSNTSLFKWNKNQLVEAVLITLMLLGIAVVVFGGWFLPIGSEYPLEFLCIPPLAWIAVRFGRRETMTATIFLSAVAIWGTLSGAGPFMRPSPNESLILLQAFMTTIGVMALTLSTTVFERKKIEAFIRAEKAEDEALLASIGDGIIATAPDGVITLVNPAFESALGWKREEVLSQNVRNIIALSDEAGVEMPFDAHPLHKALTTKQKIVATHYLARKDGSRFPAFITATPVILDAELSGAVKIFHDITRETEIDRAKTEFVSLASHQLRTPISTIKWYMELFSNKYSSKLDAKGKEYVRAVFAASERMITLINTLLDVSRLELGTFVVDKKLIDISASIVQTIEGLAPKIHDKKLKVSQSGLKQIPKIHTDPKLLSIIFQNVIGNAVRYTPEKGSIAISASADSEGVLVEVKDTGYGIKKEDHSKVFTKLFRGDTAQSKEPSGTGLGLYIAESMMEKLGGRIWFESEEDHGTTFFISLPKGRE